MKYAVIADIHGNMPALELVLADAAAHGAQGYLLLGDYSIRAPWFNQVIPALRALPNCHAIRGNEEAYLHLPAGEDAQFAICYWAAQQLQAENLAYLDALPERLTLNLQGCPVHMAHSMVTFVGKEAGKALHTSLLPLRYPQGTVSREVFQADAAALLKADKAFNAVLPTLPGGVYLFGHFHCQWSARFGEHLFINPGSCGHPLDCMEFGACYALLTVEEDYCDVELRRIPYDPQPLIEEIRRSEQYRAAPIWTELVFMDWRTCREHIHYFLIYAKHYAQKIGDPRRPLMRDTFTAAYEAWLKEGCPKRLN